MLFVLGEQTLQQDIVEPAAVVESLGNGFVWIEIKAKARSAKRKIQIGENDAASI
jgi:hypothetical protein